MIVYVDPPEGWRHGFPKVFDFKPSHPGLPGEEHEKERREWFRENGYPDELIQKGFLSHCRYWTEPEAP